jgi:hypothetical protein
VDYSPTIDPFRRIFGGGQGFDVATMGDVPQLMRNSFVAAAGSGSGDHAGDDGAYALSRFRFHRWKNNDIAFWIISQRMFPPIALVVPYFVLFNELNILDNIGSLILVYTGNEPAAGGLVDAGLLPRPADRPGGGVDGRWDDASGGLFPIALPLTLPGLMVAFPLLVRLRLERVSLRSNTDLHGGEDAAGPDRRQRDDDGPALLGHRRAGADRNDSAVNRGSTGGPVHRPRPHARSDEGLERFRGG